MGCGPVVAAMVRPPSRNAMNAPLSSSTSTRVTSRGCSFSPNAAAMSSSVELASADSLAGSSSVEASTAPSARRTTADSICVESSVSSRRAFAASIGARR